MRRAALATALISVALAPAASAKSTVVVRGAGFGHGIGMSQYGAYGFAQEGFSYRRILRHYYRGTELGRAPSRPVRVLLQASDPFVRFRGATRLNGRRARPGRLYVVRPASGGRMKVTVGRRDRRVGTFQAPLRVKTSRDSMRLMGAAINGVDSGLYRGSFELHPGALGGVTAVNALPIDPYVQGVVAAEMPSSWDFDALRAQAVAARTYALATAKSGEVFDQYPDTRSQVYTGLAGETDRTNSAVADTTNEIVTYDGDVATTYFFSTSGGRTENIENSFLGATPEPWLKSTRDPYDGISPKHRWRLRFSRSRIGARLGAPGSYRKLRVLRRGNSPRIVRARVYGTGGTRILSGPDIRARLGLFDTWAFFTNVSTSQVSEKRSRPRAARSAFPSIAGSFSPAPRSRRLIVQRREGGRWRRVSEIHTTARGRYRTTLGVRGTYRVRAGAVAGPAVRVG